MCVPRLSLLLFLVLSLFLPLTFTCAAAICNATYSCTQAGHPRLCCSANGFCGITDAYCGTDCVNECSTHHAPNPVTNITVKAGNAYVSISFNPPLSGDVVQSYEIIAQPSGQTMLVTTPKFDFTGLSNQNVSYRFQIRSLNDIGASSPVLSAYVTPHGETALCGPSKPCLSQTIPGKYDCCSSYGYCGTDVLFCGAGCQSHCSPPSNTSGITQCSALVTCASIGFPGYCCSPSGFCGQTAEYCAMGCLSDCTPIFPPAPPTNVVVTVSGGQATVSFTSPSDTGGAPIDFYQATSTPGGLTGTSTTSPITVPNLLNGVNYTFTVTARNRVATSRPSFPSPSVIGIGSMAICGGSVTCHDVGFPGYCCSQFGYCGQTSEYCGLTCQNGCTPLNYSQTCGRYTSCDTCNGDIGNNTGCIWCNNKCQLRGQSTCLLDIITPTSTCMITTNHYTILTILTIILYISIIMGIIMTLCVKRCRPTYGIRLEPGYSSFFSYCFASASSTSYHSIYTSSTMAHLIPLSLLSICILLLLSISRGGYSTHDGIDIHPFTWLSCTSNMCSLYHTTSIMTAITSIISLLVVISTLVLVTHHWRTSQHHVYTPHVAMSIRILTLFTSCATISWILAHITYDEMYVGSISLSISWIILMIATILSWCMMFLIYARIEYTNVDDKSHTTHSSQDMNITRTTEQGSSYGGSVSHHMEGMGGIPPTKTPIDPWDDPKLDGEFTHNPSFAADTSSHIALPPLVRAISAPTPSASHGMPPLTRNVSLPPRHESIQRPPAISAVSVVPSSIDSHQPHFSPRHAPAMSTSGYSPRNGAFSIPSSPRAPAISTSGYSPRNGAFSIPNSHMDTGEAVVVLEGHEEYIEPENEHQHPLGMETDTPIIAPITHISHVPSMNPHQYVNVIASPGSVPSSPRRNAPVATPFQLPPPPPSSSVPRLDLSQEGQIDFNHIQETDDRDHAVPLDGGEWHGEGAPSPRRTPFFSMPDASPPRHEGRPPFPRTVSNTSVSPRYR